MYIRGNARISIERIEIVPKKSWGASEYMNVCVHCLKN